MQRDILRLKRTNFDLVIIGGGITGACLAREATLQGLKTALVEQRDFGGFTSAASSKLLHGGIRYLPQLQFHKVRESARERAILQQIAPYLTRTVPFIIPTFSNKIMQGQVAMGAGLGLYELINWGLNSEIEDPLKYIPKPYRMGRGRLRQSYPDIGRLPHLNGAWVLPEVQMHSSERTTLAFIKSACRRGACVANYMKVTGLIRNNQGVHGVDVIDDLTGEHLQIRAKTTANAAGPMIPGLYRAYPELGLKKPTTGFSKGVHLVTRQINPDYALGLNSAKPTEGVVDRGGRHIFIIPWRGCSLIGTTNVPYHGDLARVRVNRKDVDDFLADINELLPALELKPRDVRYAFAGLYPLVAKEIRPGTYQGTGDYQIIDHHTQDGVSGLVTVLGAKYTTARIVAEKAGRLIARKLNKPLKNHAGRMIPLDGVTTNKRKRAYGELESNCGKTASSATIDHLFRRYGADILEIWPQITAFPEGDRPLSPVRNSLVGEIGYFIKEEMAITLEDIIFRRTGLGTIGNPGHAVLKQIGGLMACQLGWDQARIAEEVQRVEHHYDYN